MAAAKKKKKRQGLFEAFNWLRYRVGEYCMRGFVRVLPWLPAGFVSVLMSTIGRATFVVLWKYRVRMEQNLAMAMANELPSSEQRKSVLLRAWRNFAQGIFETICIMHASREEILETVAIEGEEHLKRALARGRGVIALSAHLGNFTVIGIRLAAGGYSFTALIKQPRDERFARLLDDYRARGGVGTISARPRREAARGVLKALRANSVVLVIADEFKSGGVPVEFFGLRSPAPRGPATLALRTGAATVPMFVTRDSDDRLTLHIEPEIELVRSGDLERDVAANTVVFTRHLEAMIRRYPDQWNWLGFQRGEGKLRSRKKVRELKGSSVEELKP
jgi:Kdo2-lipid IVA lauroyltransferase/acyltransferase